MALTERCFRGLEAITGAPITPPTPDADLSMAQLLIRPNLRLRRMLVSLGCLGRISVIMPLGQMTQTLQLRILGVVSAASWGQTSPSRLSGLLTVLRRP